VQARKIHKKEHSYKIKFSFCSLITRIDEYHEMIDSAKKAGFDSDDVEFLYIDNSKANVYDGFSGFNKFLIEAKGQYLIYCHQDILFDFENKETLEEKINEIDTLDPKWAVLGNAGKAHSSQSIVRITDANADNIRYDPLPSKVMTLDENFIIVNRRKPVSCSSQMKGFHLYATDLCQNAEHLGYSCYVIDFHLRHKSGGNPDASYRAVQHELMNLNHKRRKSQVIEAMCSRFYVSSSRLSMLIFNNKKLLNLYKSLKKKRSKPRSD